jgi:hypothetical protein
MAMDLGVQESSKATSRFGGEPKKGLKASKSLGQLKVTKQLHQQGSSILLPALTAMKAPLQNMQNFAQSRRA